MRQGTRGVTDIENAIHTVIRIYILFSSPSAVFTLNEHVWGHVNYKISQRIVIMWTIL